MSIHEPLSSPPIDPEAQKLWALVDSSGEVAKRGLVYRAVSWLGRVWEWLIGLAAMTVLLAVVATVPVLGFLSLGYLLEAARRNATEGFRSAFPGIRLASRLGTIALMGWLLLLPVRILSSARTSAIIIGNDGKALDIRRVFVVATALVVSYILWSIYRGGRLRDFFWPAPRRLFSELRSGGVYRKSRDAVYDTITSLELPRLFWLGFRGFLVAAGWLALPISCMVLSTRFSEDSAFLVALIGSLMLGGVLLYLPFAQINFAIDDRLASGFDWKRVRREFKQAPIAFAIALIATLVLAVPLYLLKAEVIPREATWLPSVVFVASIWPARLLGGWAVGRARRREELRHFVSRWSAFLAMMPVIAAYVVIVYLTQYVSWYGAWSLYEQHAFMLPVPFAGG